MIAAIPANQSATGSNPRAYDHPLARKGVRVSDAITRMVAFLVMSPGWRADRWDHSGPNFHAMPPKRERMSPERNPALKARILTELQKGQATKR